jgi:hypothetical protein
MGDKASSQPPTKKNPDVIKITVRICKNSIFATVESLFLSAIFKPVQNISDYIDSPLLNQERIGIKLQAHLLRRRAGRCASSTGAIDRLNRDRAKYSDAKSHLSYSFEKTVSDVKPSPAAALRIFTLRGHVCGLYE